MALTEFTITSIGDAAFLERVLLALAFLSNDGTIAALAKIGLISGVIVVAFKGIFMRQGPALDHVALGLIIYLGFFTIPATVVIEDVYTGQTRVVSNVPLGIAASGAGISSVGYGLTAKFEQAFSAPEMTQQGWGNSLHVLQTVRRMMLTQEDLGLADSAGGDGTSFWESWKAYVNDCTLMRLVRGETTWQYYKVQPKFADALKSESQVDYVVLRTSTGENPPRTCNDAWAPLYNFTTQQFLPEFYEKVLGQRLRQDGVPTRDQVETALMDLGFSIGDNYSVDDFILAGLLERIFNEATFDYYISNRNWTYAQAIQDGLRQRADSWLAESSMFDRFIRPMLTIIEGFAYAMAPLVVLLLGVGPIGMKVIGNFLIALVWIQLWMPLLAVVQLLSHMALTGKLSALEGTGGLPGTSLAGLLKSDGLVQEWIAVSGMVAAAVPVLSFAIVRGGSVATTALMGKMTGGDFFNEKRTAPEMTAGAPLLQQGSHAQVDPVRGLYRSDSTLQVGAAVEAQKAHQMATQVRVAKSEAFSEALSNSSARFASLTSAVGRGGSVTDTTGSTDSNTVSAGVGSQGQSGSSITRSNGKALNRSHTDQFTAGGGLGAGIHVGTGGVGGQIGISGDARFSDIAKSDTSHRNEIKSDEKADKAHSAELRSGRAVDRNVAKAKALVKRYGHEVNKGTLSKDEVAAVRQAQELISADKQYSETAQALQKVTASIGLDGRHFGALSKMRNVQNAMFQATSSDPAFASALRKTEQLPTVQSDNPDPQARRIAAALMVATGSSPFSAGISSDTRDIVLDQVLGAATGVPIGVSNQLVDGRNMNGPSVADGETQRAVEGSVKDPSMLRGAADTVAAAAPGVIAETRGNVTNADPYADGAKAQHELQEQGEQQVNSLIDPARREIEDKGKPIENAVNAGEGSLTGEFLDGKATTPRLVNEPNSDKK